ncbi:MAG: carbohydrate ABC transporter permease [Clostridiales bacterium]|nr:carbohydrate ABC transporter permease [Clostridiales bacterium]
MTSGRLSKRLSKAVFALIVCALCCVFLAPFAVMVSTSFKTNSDAFTIPVKLLPRKFVFENYQVAQSVIPYWSYMKNTVFITVLSVIGEVLVTPMVAYSLAKIKWKGSQVISVLLMGVMMIPYTVTMIPLYRLYSALHLTNTYVPLILPAFFGKPFYIIITRQFFNGLPNSLMEAARIDGANEFQRYSRIALPLCKPILTTVAIYAFIDAWSDYLAPMIYINKQQMLTLSLGLQQYMNEYTVRWTELMAAATMFVLPVVVFFIIFQRNFVQGIATSGLKA